MEISDNSPLIGIIGTGWVGNSYAKNFQNRGVNPVLYSLDPKYYSNRERIKECDVVIIAVPTPATHNGADYSIIKEVIKLVGRNKIALIKSTVLPGTTDELQEENPNIIVIHSPEFLSKITADYDTAYPKRNIIGLPNFEKDYIEAIKFIIEILPKAPFLKVCSAVEAEVIKFSHNCGGLLRIVFSNLLFDICEQMGGDWTVIKESISADPDDSPSYLNPVHKNGRGAGGSCFIKDFSNFINFYKNLNDELGLQMLESIEQKNLSLLESSGKDLEVLSSMHFIKKQNTEYTK